MTAGERLAMAAVEHIGARFQLYGRDPAFGLDCVGLVHVSLVEIGRAPHTPKAYRLRNSRNSEWTEFAARSGFDLITDRVITGDVLMVEVGPAQQHLLIAETQSQFIHAHAGLRRVVRQCFDDPLAVIAHWRLSAENEEV